MHTKVNQLISCLEEVTKELNSKGTDIISFDELIHINKSIKQINETVLEKDDLSDCLVDSYNLILELIIENINGNVSKTSSVAASNSFVHEIVEMLKMQGYAINKKMNTLELYKELFKKSNHFAIVVNAKMEVVEKNEMLESKADEPAFLRAILEHCLSSEFMKRKESKSFFTLNNELEEFYVTMKTISRENQESLIELKPTQHYLNVNLEKVNKKLMHPLTVREFEVISELVKGTTNKKIAETLFVSVNTIKTQLSNIYSKLGVNSRDEVLERVSALEFD